jgi:hypothetical protein
LGISGYSPLPPACSHRDAAECLRALVLDDAAGLLQARLDRVDRAASLDQTGEVATLVNGSESYRPELQSPVR